ncbi:transcription initiation at TATA-containing promoter protein [Basidiobolus ranarum]|uniref:Transcription initiation at TATA-containing promoter protein n=1 Tax=Basidiobolus ranarum TaxID=34480 RepID=A0ABR2WKB8_9FUNG
MPRGHYRFCESILEELNRKRHANTVYPFLRPVDWRAMNLFDYPTIIKHPMDISTIKKNLESGSYVCIEQFETDFRLMFNNCFRYNPVNTPVYDMGKSIEKVFDLMWSKRPLSSSSVLRETSSKPRLNSAEKPFNEGNQTSQIAAMQRHSEFMTRQLESMKDLIQDKKVDRTLQSSWTTKVDMLRKSRSGTTSSHKLRKITVPKYSGYEDPPSSKSSGGGPDSSLGSSSSDTKDSPVPLRKRSSLAYSRSLMELNICNKTARYSDQIIPSGNQITSEAVPIGTLELATRAPNQKNQISNEHKVTDAVNTQNADQWVALIKDAEPNETQTGNKAIDLIWAKPSSDAKTKWEQVSISYEKDKKFAEQRGEETIRAERYQLEEQPIFFQVECNHKRQEARSQQYIDAKHCFDFTHQAWVMAAFERELYKDQEARERERIRFTTLMASTASVALSSSLSQAETLPLSSTRQSHHAQLYLESDNVEIAKSPQG